MHKESDKSIFLGKEKDTEAIGICRTFDTLAKEAVPRICCKLKVKFFTVYNLFFRYGISGSSDCDWPHGEALPFMMPRIDKALPTNITKLNSSVADYLRENIYYTFSGFNFTQTFLDLYLQVGADQIMFSADYPYSSKEQARSFLDQLPVSFADKNKIAHGNVELLLHF
jgi:hypothetical protein